MLLFSFKAIDYLLKIILILVHKEQS